MSDETESTAPAGSPIVRIVRPRCAQLFVIFAAGGDVKQAFAERGAFFQMSGLAGRNLILIRDPYEANYAEGVGGHLRSVSALAAWIHEKRAEMTHVREVHCLGHSSGGYGAILFGHLVGADRVFAFSPRAAPHMPEWAKRSLVDRLAEHNGVTSYRICFAAEHAVDRAFAERLARCPAVTLEPRPELGAVHDALPILMRNGELKAMLPAFVAAEAA